MYVVGNNDRLGGIRELNRKAAEISGNRLYVVENAGHTPYLDNREGFLSAIKGFLDEEN
jgi:pimeloyl-ACP methyl ester carboxylesterase